MKAFLRVLCFIFFIFAIVGSLLMISTALWFFLKYGYSWRCWISITAFLSVFIVSIFGFLGTKRQNKTNVDFNSLLLIIGAIITFENLFYEFSNNVVFDPHSSSLVINWNIWSSYLGLFVPVQTIFLVLCFTLILPVFRKRPRVQIILSKIALIINALLQVFVCYRTISTFAQLPSDLWYGPSLYFILSFAVSFVAPALFLTETALFFFVNSPSQYVDSALFVKNPIPTEKSEPEMDSSFSPDGSANQNQGLAKTSFFDGNVLQYLGWMILCSLVTTISLGILYPVTVCWMINWKFKHTVYDGYRLTFNGNGFQLLGKWVSWLLLSLITVGIYAFFLPVKIEKWKTKHTHLTALQK